MPSDVMNGSTMTFGSAVADLRSISLTVNGNPVDLTDLADSKMVYLNGIPDYEIQATVTGTSSIDPTDAAAALTIAWNDGTTLPSAVNYICTNASTSGSVNGAIETTLTFKPAAS